MSVNIEQSQLKNGLKIIKINLPNFHTITNFLVIRSGSRYEDKKVNGIAHFLEHMVFKGTKSFADTKVIAEALEGVGGYFNAWTSQDHTAYWNIVPAAQWQMGIQMASELAFYPKLPAADLERERGVIIEEIRRMNDDPASLVDDLLGPILFPSSPLGYSVIGSEEIIKSVTIEDFKKYHAAHYLPSQAAFVCVGNLDGKDIDGEIEKLLGGFAAGEVSQPESVTTPSKAALKVLNKKTDQTHFILGMADPIMRLNEKKRFIAAVLNGVLGHGMSSRLFLNIREKKGLAYSISSYFQPFEDTGVIQVSGGVNTEKVHQTLEALDEELLRLQTELVSPEELKKAKNHINGSFDLSADRPVDMATWYGTSWLLGMTETYEEAKVAVEKVTAEQVREMAKLLFVKDRQVLAVIGPYDDTKKFEDFLGVSAKNQATTNKK
ncbi:MAG TPA: pitrilysin family protein [Candidatus Saccharimonadales bacterium]|nr:pitrilysin family protein [Candidatus Saccharimonadales bacterium]